MDAAVARRTAFRFVKPAVLAAALAAPPAGVALLGAPGPLVLRLNLGPGDARYLSGFAPQYEIDDGLARRWTRGRAEVRLPLQVQGGPRAVTFRFGPPPMSREEAAAVRVTVAGVEVERFALPGGGMQLHRSEVSLPGRVPLILGFDVRWPGPEDLGLWMDWIEFEVPAGQEATLLGPARWQAATTVALAFVFLLGAGWRPGWAATATMPASLIASLALRHDPWLVHQLLSRVPEALVLFGLVVGVGAAIARRRGATPRDLACVSGLLLAAFLLRGIGLNTPGYYHPDLRSHARLALAIREAGTSFLADPAKTVARVGHWENELGGRRMVLPYAPGFHLPLAASSLAYDDVLRAEKLLGAAVSTIPLALLFVLARRCSASPLGALLLLTAPTYGRHLAVAFLPALFGHAWDVGFLTWIAHRRERLGQPRVFATAALWVAACQLAYVSAVTLIPAFLGCLAVTVLVFGAGERTRSATTILGLGLAGSALSVLVYYRHFLGPILEALPQLLASSPPASGSPREGFLEVAMTTTRFAFSPLVLVLAAVGLSRLTRSAGGRVFLSAWALAYVVLLLGRALLPALLQFQHEALFVTPLVFLGAGEAIAWLGSRGTLGRGAAFLLGFAVLALGAIRQWNDLVEQLVHAR